MDRNEYALKLRDPRWQRKRLEIFQRDDFSCKKCSAEDLQLHVHHKYYRWGSDPWDYPDEALVTLCEPCHEAASEQEAGRKALERQLIEFMRERDLGTYMVGCLACHVSEKGGSFNQLARLFSELTIDGKAFTFGIREAMKSKATARRIERLGKAAIAANEAAAKAPTK